MRKNALALLMFISQTTAFADDIPRPLELGFVNSFLTSQEYMKHYFADFDSKIRPIPAYVLAIYAGWHVSESTVFSSTLSIPTREETARFDDGRSWTYYYPKSHTFLLERSLGEVDLGRNVPLSNWIAFGGNSPLSHRFFSVLFPTQAWKVRIGISDSAGLLLGIGYSGNIARGVWLVPFGFTYRL